MAECLFASKAKTLIWLQDNSDFFIPQVFPVTIRDWRAKPGEVARQIVNTWKNETLAVRSSCSMEDSHDSSGAGAFTSLLGVTPTIDGLSCAIDTVFESYKLSDMPDTEEVLVQPMVTNIVVSGVILTKTLADGAPYYVINYDDESGRTDTITGGTGVSKTVYVYRETGREAFDSERLRTLYTFARKIESVCGWDNLDIEFGMDDKGVVHLFQVRPICCTHDWDSDAADMVRAKIGHVVDFLEELFKRKPDIHGGKTILGVMPDWNPAEMIGVTPAPLASSLYRTLITRRIWSRAREAMGYRSMPAEELMVLMAGRPFIDVRASFNSFLPDGLEPGIGEKLVNAWLDYLDEKPEMHDKIEFDVALTVMDFCFDEHLDERYPDLLDPGEREIFRHCLSRLTRNCLELGEDGSLHQAETAIQSLHSRQQKRDLPTDAYFSHIVNYLEECREFGTLPFSILARHGFIAESLLRTAVRRGAISAERVKELKASIETISGRMHSDFARVVNGDESREGFLHEYGHLRPATYDILSPCYDRREKLFQVDGKMPLQQGGGRFELSEEEGLALEALLSETGLDSIAPEGLMEYVGRAIAGREYAKFVFTRNVSDILEMLAAWGNRHGFTREDLSYLDIDDVARWKSESLLCDPRDYFNRKIAEGRELLTLGRSLQLGYLVRSAADVYVVPQHRSAPNFVGSGCLENRVVTLDAHSSCDVDLKGAIVCIENADPGYDWIFTRGIAGLVTRFGGANSHMAIRCAEYGLPAAIGVGDKLFSECAAASEVILNVDSKIVKGA